MNRQCIDYHSRVFRRGETAERSFLAAPTGTDGVTVIRRVVDRAGGAFGG